MYDKVKYNKACNLYTIHIRQNLISIVHIKGFFLLIIKSENLN